MQDIKSVQSGPWSDPNTWDLGRVPDFGDKVWIMEDHVVEIDTDAKCGPVDGYFPATPYPYQERYLSLVIRGTLRVSRTVNTSLDCRGIVGGDCNSSSRQCIFDAGTPDDPIPANISFTWYRNNVGLNARGSYYGFGFRGYAADREPRFSIVSAHYRRRCTYLLQRAQAGDTVIYAADTTGWQPGDKLLLAPIWEEATSVYPYDQPGARNWEWAIIQNVNGNEVTLTAPLSYDHGYDDPAVQRAGAVNNFTSNVVVEGGGSNTIFPATYNLMARVHVENVVFTYANNIWSGSASVLYIFKCASATNTPAIVKGCAFHADAKDLPYNLNQVIYHYYDITHSRTEDVAIAAECADGKYVAWGLVGATSGGFDIYYKDVDLFVLKEFSTYGFNLGSQVHHLDNCRVIASRRSYYPAGTIGAFINNCWAIGCQVGWSGRNSTPIFEDFYLHGVGSFSDMPRDWMSLGEVRRLHYKPGLVRNEKIYRSAPDQTPASCHTYLEINEDPTNNVWFWADGEVRTATDTRSGSGLSIHMSTFETGIPIPYQRAFEVQAGDTILVGVYVKRLQGDGILRIRLRQGSVQLLEQDYNLADFPAGEWKFINMGTPAHHTGTVQWEFFLIGGGGDPEIILSDFLEPFTTDEVRQAKAVWAELTADNTLPGSFGEYLGQLLKGEVADAVWDEPLADHQDAGSTGEALEEASNCSGGGGATSEEIWTYANRTLTGPVDVGSIAGTSVSSPDDLKADVSDLAKEATVQAIKTKTDNLPPDPAKESTLQTVKTVIQRVEAGQLGGLEIRDAGDGTAELVLYDADNTTIVAAFRLYNKTGLAHVADIDDKAIVKRERK